MSDVGPAEAGGSKIAKTVVKYSIKYGPLLYEAVKHGREPAQRALQRAMARQGDRRRAFKHAETLVEGSVLRVFRDGEPIWVVFSEDHPVAAYPVAEAELTVLLEHADLGQRVRPGSGKPKLPDLKNLPKPPNPADLPRLARKVLRRDQDGPSGKA
ncbi:hypothetical protein [Flindersiella endophytica]